MGRIAKLIQSQIEKYILNTVQAHYSQNQLCYQYDSAGVDAPPLPSDRVIMVPVEGTGNYVTCGVLAVSQGAEPGDRIVYSRDKNGNVMAKISLKNDGSVEVQTAGDGKFSLVSTGDLSINADGKNINITAAKFSVNDGNLEVS